LAVVELGGASALDLASALAGSRVMASGRADAVLAARGNADAARRLVVRAKAFAEGTEKAEERERRRVVEALAKTKPEGWLDALEANLPDVRLRDALVPALATSGRLDVAKRIAALLEEEREPSLRIVELAALEALHAKKELEAGLRFVAGLPEPPGAALEQALAAKLVREGNIGCALVFEKKGRVLARDIGTMKRGPWRILAKGTVDEGGVATFELDGEQRLAMTATTDRADVFYATPPTVGQAKLTLKPGPGFHVEALWLVPATQDPALTAAHPRKAEGPEAHETETCTGDASCAKASPAATPPPPPATNFHTNRVDPARKAGAIGAAKAKQEKDLAASKPGKVDDPTTRAKRTAPAPTNETTP
jgi:hypothetical protein